MSKFNGLGLPKEQKAVMEGVARRDQRWNDDRLVRAAHARLHRASLEPAPSPEDGIHRRQEIQTLTAVLLTLAPREERVVRLLHGIGCEEHTLREVAEQFSLNPERIRQINAKALRKMKHPSRMRKLEQVLDARVSIPPPPRREPTEMEKLARYIERRRREAQTIERLRLGAGRSRIPSMLVDDCEVRRVSSQTSTTSHCDAVNPWSDLAPVSRPAPTPEIAAVLEALRKIGRFTPRLTINLFNREFTNPRLFRIQAFIRGTDPRLALPVLGGGDGVSLSEILSRLDEVRRDFAAIDHDGAENPFTAEEEHPEDVL